MIECKRFYDCLLENDIDFFTGVPDSLLKDFCAYVTDNTDSRKNWPTNAPAVVVLPPMEWQHANNVWREWVSVTGDGRTRDYVLVVVFGRQIGG